MIDKHGVQGMLELIFTNKFKNKLLWSVTSTLVFFLPLLARGAHFTTQHHSLAIYHTIHCPGKKKIVKTNSPIVQFQVRRDN